MTRGEWGVKASLPYIMEQITQEMKIKTGKPLHNVKRYVRRGQCNRCGWCCEYRVCSEYLRYDEDGQAVCLIYEDRPPECQRFPQAPPILNPKCGYYFLDTWEDNRVVKFGKDL